MCHNRYMNTATADHASRLAAVAQATDSNRQAGDSNYKVRDGAALYTFRRITPEVAADLGCPHANAILIGQHGHIVGQAIPVTGRIVKVSGWGYRFGTLTRFVAGVGPDDVLFGHVGAVGGER